MNVSSVGSACVGCENCANICHSEAIILEENTEGFIYPRIEMGSCNECGKCLTVCPIRVNKSDVYGLRKSYMAICNNRECYTRAASGGIFGSIAKKFFDKYDKALVCGATYLDGEVKHIIINSADDIPTLQNSKYVQSRNSAVFKEITTKLKEGYSVLFSGTPCQVQALKNFVGVYSDNLYTIDLICHGVPSPKFFKKDIKAYKIPDVVDVSFRWKKRDGRVNGFFMSIKGKKRTRIIPNTVDPYFTLFINGETYRESCYQCIFANLQRVGDLTIGDCDSHQEQKEFYDDYLVSTVIINTVKGEKIWNNCNDEIDYKEMDLEKEVAVNQPLRSPTVRPQKRDSIYKEIEELSFRELQEKYARGMTIARKLFYIMLMYLPKSVHVFALNIIRRNK